MLFRIALIVILLGSGMPPAEAADAASADLSVQWQPSLPIAKLPTFGRCSCLNAVVAPMSPPANNSPPRHPPGSFNSFQNNCPAAVSIFLLQDHVPPPALLSVTQPSQGRNFAYFQLAPQQSARADVSGAIGGLLGVDNCPPSAFTALPPPPHWR